MMQPASAPSLMDGAGFKDDQLMLDCLVAKTCSSKIARWSKSSTTCKSTNL